VYLNLRKNQQRICFMNITHFGLAFPGFPVNGICISATAGYEHGANGFIQRRCFAVECDMQFFMSTVKKKDSVQRLVYG
jgi:hypothetical protein